MDDLSSCEEEEFFDAYNPEELLKHWQIKERDLLKVAENIGSEWMRIGIHLGYQSVTMNHLEDVYPRQPQWRNFMMIAQWCDVVSKLYLNVRLYLANALFKANRSDIADMISNNYKDVKPPEEIYHHVQHITFDRPINRTLELYDIRYIQSKLGTPKQVKYVLELIQGPATLPQTTHHRRKPKLFSAVTDSNESLLGTMWSMDNMASALPELTSSGGKCDILNLVRELSLEEFYPSKISIIDVRRIKSPNIQCKKSDLPWLLLIKIIMLNYSAREEDLIHLFETNRNNSNTCNTSDNDSDDDLFEDSTTCSINPCDLLYVTFLCCDQLLKVEFLTKLFACRLAIPFIFRDSEERLMLSQMALRTILIDKYSNQKSIQMNALYHDMKIVSFVRIGQQCVSKSKLINEILSDRYHQTFFNRDCPLGTSQRKLANGIVEAAWYLPSGKEDDFFKDVTMFLNLRGNCTNFIDALETICRISHIIVVHISVNQLTLESDVDTLIRIHEHSRPVIYALESNIETNNRLGLQPAKVLKDYKTKMSHYKTNMKFFNLKSSQYARSSSDVTKELRKLLSDSASEQIPVQLIKIVQSLGISDEDMIPQYKHNKQLALDVLATIPGNVCIEKKNILPLQGEAWLDWCAANKKANKAKYDEEVEILMSKMSLSRAEQIFKLRFELHPFMALFLKNIQSNFHDTQNFLAWLKLLLDEKSRSVLPQLVFDYQQLWLAMKSSIEGNRQDIDILKKRVDCAEKTLVDASFGLEHLVRELGQIYEAVMLHGDYINTGIAELPKLMSNLMQQGFPLEILNGDAAMIPKAWIAAVLKQLAEDTGDKQILTVSVLGIQSSGKSTLLNAMFGLQFAVSAGRCTRGVFAQLVHVTDNLLPYEYVLVIDTEGLRAPELADQKHSHDNELATFVLGLGNISIINIKGENTAEMEDVLQIAVHAFLRLKMANMRLKLQQTCIFVHQNVPAMDAASKMTHARQKMMEKLDKLTSEAAKHEGLSDIHSFNQVLEINTENHMWYFSDLWAGDPPMAPINLGYSKNVNDVRQQILYKFARKKQLLSITETIMVINDLWKGILSDDFVFSFRNSLEVKAYHMMETWFYRIHWKIDNKMQQFIQQRCNTQIARCTDPEAMNKTSKELCHSLEQFLKKQAVEGIESFNNLIENCAFCTIMDQWRQTKICQFQECIRNLLRNGRMSIEATKLQFGSELLRTTKRSAHELELRTKAQDLAHLYKGKTLSSQELSAIFNGMWDKWISGFQHENIPKKCPIENVVQDTLFEIFGGDRALLSNELREAKRVDYIFLAMLEGSITYQDLKDHHISIPQGIAAKLFGKFKLEKYKKKAFLLINAIFTKVDTFLSNLMSEGKPFEKAHAFYVFMTFKDSIDEHNLSTGNSTKYTITAALKVKLAVHIAIYVTKFFRRLDNLYEQKHNVLAQMEEYKYSVKRVFLDEFENKREEQKISNYLMVQLEKIVQLEIKNAVPGYIVQTVLEECFITKYTLLLSILKDLAVNEDFAQYILYIGDAKTFSLRWLSNFTYGNFFSGKSSRKLKIKYETIVSILIARYRDIIVKHIQRASQLFQTENDQWVNIFEKSLSEDIPIQLNTFIFAKRVKHVNFLNIQTCLMDQVSLFEKRLKEEFLTNAEKTMEWLGHNTNRILLDKLWGCEEKCPFCEETCQRTTKHHPEVNHTCVHHRPSGIVGTREKKTQKLNCDSCNFNVYSNASFNCVAAGSKCKKSKRCPGKKNEIIFHKYRDFKQVIPDWDIEPSSVGGTTMYWKWFIYRFRRELAETYDYIVPREVQKWKLITKDDAIHSLSDANFKKY